MEHKKKEPFSVRLVKKTFSSRFTLARLTRRSRLFRKLIDRVMFKDDEIYFLPKNKVITIDQDAGSLDTLVLPSTVLDTFIDQASYLWINNKCICRDTAHCKDYPVELGCLFLGDAARGINPALGREVTRGEAKDHVRACREAGLVHLVGRNKLDTVWLHVSPGYKLLTVCNCCPCCCLWRMLPDLAPEIGKKISRMPGVSVEVDQSRCVGCRTCEGGTCFVNAIEIVGNKARINDDRCRGCGRCVDVCPKEAIVLHSDGTIAIESAVKAINRLVDLS